jgi:hypothetical protein
LQLDREKFEEEKKTEKAKLNLEREKFELEKSKFGTTKKPVGADSLVLKRLTEVEDTMTAVQADVASKLDAVQATLSQLLPRMPSADHQTDPPESSTPPRRVVQTRNSRGPYVQKLDPDTLDVVKVYDGAMEAVREEGISVPGLKRAADKASVYHDHRWIYVPRTEDPHVKHAVPPTSTTVRKVVHGWVAQLNYMKTEITAVYVDQKEATKANGFKGRSSISMAVKDEKPAGRSFYQLWKKCAPELTSAYVEKNGEPSFTVPPKIDEFDVDGKLLAQYASKQDVVNKMGMSHKKLGELLQSGTVYRDRVFKWTRGNDEDEDDEDKDDDGEGSDSEEPGSEDDSPGASSKHPE